MTSHETRQGWTRIRPSLAVFADLSRFNGIISANNDNQRAYGGFLGTATMLLVGCLLGYCVTVQL